MNVKYKIMKKKIFFAVATIVAAASVGYAAYLNQKVEISDALLENIEALSDEENEQGTHYKYVFPGADPTVECVSSGKGDEKCCFED